MLLHIVYEEEMNIFIIAFIASGIWYMIWEARVRAGLTSYFEYGDDDEQGAATSEDGHFSCGVFDGRLQRRLAAWATVTALNH